MTNEALLDNIKAIWPEVVAEVQGEFVTVQIQPHELIPVATTLLHEPDLQFDFLLFLTAIDWKTHLEICYHLDSYAHLHHLVIKVKLDALAPQVPSVVELWPTANFHEREVYELFGVSFLGHPDLRLLILPDGWEGKNPLRKDFEDPVNMIKL
jgi:NADH:ubiquinone oxidoreductase subunit C